MKPRDYPFERLRSLAPTLPETGGLIVFDDVCVLCSGFVQWVLTHDHDRRFWFTSAQGPMGQALYNDLGLDPQHFETNLVLIEGKVCGKLGTVVKVASRLGGVWRVAGVLLILPDGLQDLIYDSIARNRFRLFGRRSTCWLPSPETAERVL